MKITNNTHNYFLKLRPKNSSNTSNTTTTTNLYLYQNTNFSLAPCTNDLTTDTHFLILHELTKYLGEPTENNNDPISWWCEKRAVIALVRFTCV